MNILTINEETINQILTYKDCIDLLKEAHIKLANKQAFQPLRSWTKVEDQNAWMITMPAYIGGDETNSLGLKVISIFPENINKNLDSHQGSIILLDPNTGVMKAILDANSITAYRTASASTLASITLAKNNPKTLAIIGTGVQAKAHVEAMLSAHTLKEVFIWGRTKEKAIKLSSFGSTFNIPIKVKDSVKEAVEFADIVVTVTASSDPLVQYEWLKQGTLVIAVGSAVKSKRELDSKIIQESRIFTDAIESVMNEAGDILIPLHDEGLKLKEELVEIGDALVGKKPGRKNQEEILVYKSLGLGIQDLVIAEFVYNEALKRKLE